MNIDECREFLDQFDIKYASDNIDVWASSFLGGNVDGKGGLMFQSNPVTNEFTNVWFYTAVA